MRRHRLWPIALAAAACGAPEAAAAQAPPTSAQVRAAVRAEHASFAHAQFVPGMAVAVVSPSPGGRLVTRTFVYGRANVARRVPVTPATQFEIGSETKVFTAALLARAARRGIVGLGNRVTAFLPSGFTAPTRCNRTFSLAQLATHRSGLPRLPANYGPTPADHADYTRTQLFGALQTTTLGACPGAAWRYSNFGYGLLGTVLADAEHQTFGRLVAQQITRPLGMSATGLERPTPLLATGYCADRSVAPRWDNVGALAGGGGLISSIRDMAVFVRAGLGSGPAPVVRALATSQTPIAPGNRPGMRMGLAWQIYTIAGFPGPSSFKNGGTNGMHSATTLVPAARLGVTVLTNGPADASPVSGAIVHTLLGVPAARRSPRDGDAPASC